ncbi:LADA_0B08856g1_1 [Lachancea dasiensis]|uniref:LADA_0B08856g1_1 n=1 Tax=Lachancea dasiensis TaxID=1072105 RepID=A0A1G4IUN0_9SACH|nr:LADA_0B08856g1_1 [Lachancea dasiensis]
MSDETVSPQVVNDLVDYNEFNQAFKEVFCGTIGGFAQVLVGQPFDMTKVRMQTSSVRASASEVIRKLVKNEGILAFYKGTLVPLVGVGACVSCQFGVNEAMKRYFRWRHRNDHGMLTPGQYYMSGFVSGTANAFLATPIEHVRIRLQLQTGSKTTSLYYGSWDCARKLLRQGALMRGFTATTLRTSHGFGIYFFTYEALLANEARRGVLRQDVPAWKVSLFGALAGACFWATTYPFDVVKSVIQADKLRNPVYGTSVVQVGKAIYRERGPRVFVSGFMPAMLRSLPVNGATFAAFETTMRLIK